MDIGEKIKYYREERGMTQKDLADAIGTIPQTIYKYEKGVVSNLPLSKVKAIAKALGVDAGKIVGWEDKKTTDEVRLTDGEKQLIELFRKIPEDKKDIAIQMLKVALQMK